MDVMVLGHNGMLGHMVVKYLSDKGCNITTCDYKFPTNEFKEFVSQYKGYYIINCIGAIPQKTKAFSINYELPVWLDTYATCNVIHPGTDCEMDFDDYGVSKKAARDYIVESGIRTKILKTSIIGPELNSSFSLLEWFLSQTNEVYGYTNAMWNGNTTLEWATQCYKLMNSWNSYKLETILEGECVSKFELLNKFNLVFQKKILILEKDTELCDKCLIGDIQTDSIIDQLYRLKKYYYETNR
jgi:dTDP-4-dehydrorhamnose reductase